MQEEAKQSTGTGGADRIAALKAKVDEVGNLAQQLAAAQTAARRTRLGIVIIILLIILGYGYVVYRDIKRFDTTRFIAEVRAKMLDPKVGTMREFLDMVQRVVPVYQQEIEKQFAEEWPNIKAKIESESKDFLEKIGEKAEAKVKDRLVRMAKRQEQRLLQEFPELKDEKTREIVMTSLEKALQGAVIEVFEARMEKAKERFADVYEKILQFMPEESRESFPERMAKVWDQLLLYELGGSKLIKP